MHCQENWSLSPEEFEIWDRLYRLKENDGVKQPILPHTWFETLENLDETSVSLTQCNAFLALGLMETLIKELPVSLKDACLKNAILRISLRFLKIRI